jgi:hypothetical protein
MRRLLLILSVLLTVLIAPVTPQLEAQDGETPGETWYFATAWGDTNSALTAFTLDGESRVLFAEGVSPRPDGSWRLGPQLALAVLRVNDVPGLYQMTPDEARRLRPTFEAGNEEDWLPTFPISAYPPYVVMAVTPRPPASPALLVNLETGTFDLLTGHADVLRAPPVFSADGRYLRYVSWDFEANSDWQTAPWTLWERELATGSERPVHTLTNANLSLAHDRYGEGWMNVSTDPDRKIQTYTYSYLDGTQETLAEFNLSDQSSLAVYRLFDDHLLVFDPFCETACKMSFHPLAGGDLMQFVLPEQDFAFGPLRWIDATRLLAAGQETIWLMNSDGTTQVLGYWSPMSVFVSRDAIASPDGRWVLVINDVEDPTHYSIVDTLTGTAVATGEMEVGAMVWYRDGGFLATNNQMRNFMLYRDVDQTVVWLPEVEKGQYLDVQPDGMVLYAQFVETDTRDPGLYRYDPAADTFTFLFDLMDPIALTKMEALTN